MKTKSINPKSAYILLICLAFSVDSILRYVEQIVARVPLIGDFYPLFTPALFIILIALSWCYWKMIRLVDVVFLGTVLLLLIVSFWVFPANREYIEKNLVSLVFTILPFYFLGRNLDVSDEVKEALFKVSEIAIAIAWIYLLYYYSSGREFSSDAMYESYALVVHTLMVLWAVFEHPSVFRFIFAGLGILYALCMGTRGPVVLIVAFVVFLLFWKSRTNLKWKILISFLLLLAVLVLTNQQIMVSIVLYFKDLVGGWGLSTRIFDDYLFDVAQDSLDERMQIYQTLLSHLKENPFGFGLYGEYPFVDWSAHNIYLQFCFEFGLVLGPIFMAFLCLSAYRSLNKNPSSNNVCFIWLWLCYIIPQGFFGGNLISFYFFFALGFIFGQIEKKKDLLFQKKIQRVNHEYCDAVNILSR